MESASLSSFIFTFLSIFIYPLNIIQLVNAKTNYVTCGSVVKLMNSYQEVRLHSHDVKYGSGSGQQSVTGVEDSDDHNSHWSIMSVNNTACNRGQPIKCGDYVRLFHLSTGCFLHSHLFTSPLSQNYQEVSCFGKDGQQSDTGDFWRVECGNDLDDDFWTRPAEVRFMHNDTMVYLGISGRQYNRPIHGQREVCGFSVQSARQTLWKTQEGVFIQPSGPLSTSSHKIHDDNLMSNDIPRDDL